MTFGNDALARIYGLDSPDAIPGTHILDLVAPSAREMTWKIFSEAVSGGKAPGSIEIPTLRKNGEVVQTEVKPTVILQKDGTVTTQGLLIDITERKRAEKALRKSEERLDLALKATQDAVWDWDLSTNELYYSSRCWDIVGYEENEVEVNPDLWRRLIHPEDLERADLIIEAIVGETSFELETRLLHKDGHYVPVLTRGFILRDDNGKAVRLSGTIADLTERKKMEEERRQWERQQQQLQKSESLNRMAGAVAHIFNNKLSTGSGIEVKEVEEIFDPFFTTKFTGRGLGLSVVLGVVRAHRGVVTVESAPDRGSVFRVFFPLSGQQAPLQSN